MSAGSVLIADLSTTARKQAAELVVIDQAVSQSHETSRRSAAAARRLVGRVEALAAHSRRLDAMLRRSTRAASAPSSPRAWEVAGPVLFKTPSRDRATKQLRAAVG